MESLKRFVQQVKLINSTLVLICIVGFVYQVYLIFNQYMLGKTVVNIDLKIMKEKPLPAITICTSSFFSITKLSKSSRWNETFNQSLDNYNNLFKQIRKANDTNWKTLEGNMNQIYNYITEKINLTGANFEELFELSIEGKINILIEGGSE